MYEEEEDVDEETSSKVSDHHPSLFLIYLPLC